MSYASVKECGAILTAGAGADASPAFGPLLVTALRFTLGLPCVLLFWGAARSWRLRRSDLPPLLKVSIPMAVGFLTHAAGLAWTTATLSAFLSSLFVCGTPLLEWLLAGRRPSWRLSLAVLMAVVASALMCMPGGAWRFGLGEALTLACMVAFSFQIYWTGECSKRLGAARLTAGSFALLLAASWAATLACPGSVAGALSAASVDVVFWAYFSALFLGSTLGAVALMNVFQARVRPTEAAVIYTTEPVFAMILAWALLGQGEGLRGWAIPGAALILVADVLAASRGGEGASD